MRENPEINDEIEYKELKLAVEQLQKVIKSYHITEQYKLANKMVRIFKEMAEEIQSDTSEKIYDDHEDPYEKHDPYLGKILFDKEKLKFYRITYKTYDWDHGYYYVFYAINLSDMSEVQPEDRRAADLEGLETNSSFFIGTKEECLEYLDSLRTLPENKE